MCGETALAYTGSASPFRDPVPIMRERPVKLRDHNPKLNFVRWLVRWSRRFDHGIDVALANPFNSLLGRSRVCNQGTPGHIFILIIEFRELDNYETVNRWPETQTMQPHTIYVAFHFQNMEITYLRSHGKTTSLAVVLVVIAEIVILHFGRVDI